MNIVVAGSRSLTNHQLVYEVLNQVVQKSDVILQGGAKGADALAKTWARTHHIACQEFPARWEEFGRFAGPKRNREMALAGDCLIAFWNGISAGTGDMIKQMQQLKKPIFYVRYDADDQAEILLEEQYRLAEFGEKEQAVWVKEGVSL